METTLLLSTLRSFSLCISLHSLDMLPFLPTLEYEVEGEASPFPSLFTTLSAPLAYAAIHFVAFHMREGAVVVAGPPRDPSPQPLPFSRFCRSQGFKVGRR